jgi:hypothetical protein
MRVHDIAARLPDIETLRRRCKALAMLDAIMSPEWEYRYYSFDAAWAEGEHMASMANGSGDEYSIVFTPAGAFIRGFDHESPMSPWTNEDRHLWPGLLDGLPPALARQAAEPAFSLDGTLSATFCLWRETGATRWSTGRPQYAVTDGLMVDDGSDMLSMLCDQGPDSYRAFAVDYYETAVSLAAVAAVCALRPLDSQLVAALNPEITIADLASDMAQIGWPR